MRSSFRYRYLGPGRGVLVAGWAFSIDNPSYQHSIGIRVVDGKSFCVKADQFRPDLAELGFGHGFYGFRIVLDLDLLDGSNFRLEVFDSTSRQPLFGSPCSVSLQNSLKISELKVDPGNISKINRTLVAAEIDSLLVDTNDTCNADCVYCPNLRSRNLIELVDFQRFLAKSIASVRYIQFGCGQEPTLDSRLPEFFAILGESKIEAHKISMITNGSFLSRHMWKNYIGYGLKELQVSIDTIIPEINNKTRSGTNIEKILSDLEALSIEIPDLELVFSITVNSMSIYSIESLFDFGRKISVKSY